MTCESALAEFIASAFNAEELRIFLGKEPEGKEICRSLPTPPASLEKLAHDTVQILADRNLVDHRFFARLTAARPRRKDDINRVRALWLSEVEDEHPISGDDGPADLRANRNDARTGLPRILAISLVLASTAVLAWLYLIAQGDAPQVAPPPTVEAVPPGYSQSSTAQTPSRQPSDDTNTRTPLAGAEKTPCDDARIINLLDSLKRKCATDGPLEYCKSENPEGLFNETHEILALLSKFPGALAIHFPSGQPAPFGRGDQGSQSRVHLLLTGHIRTVLAEFLAARRVLVVAVVSGGDPASNRNLALRRAVFAHDLLLQTSAAVLGEEAGGIIAEKSSLVYANARSPINVALYRAHFSNEIAAWTPKDRERAVRLVGSGNLDPSSNDWKWLSKFINQAAYIIPISCEK